MDMMDMIHAIDVIDDVYIYMYIYCDNAMFPALGSHCSPNLEACHVSLNCTHAAITAPVLSESIPKAYKQ